MAAAVGLRRLACVAHAYNALVPHMRALGHTVNPKSSHHIAEHEKKLERGWLGYLDLVNALGERGLKYLDIKAQLSKLDGTTQLPVQKVQPPQGMSAPPAPPAAEATGPGAAEAVAAPRTDGGKRNRAGHKCMYGCGNMMVVATGRPSNVFMPTHLGVAHTSNYCPVMLQPAGKPAPLVAQS